MYLVKTKTVVWHEFENAVLVDWVIFGWFSVVLDVRVVIMDYARSGVFHGTGLFGLFHKLGGLGYFINLLFVVFFWGGGGG